MCNHFLRAIRVAQVFITFGNSNRPIPECNRSSCIAHIVDNLDCLIQEDWSTANASHFGSLWAVCGKVTVWTLWGLGAELVCSNWGRGLARTGFGDSPAVLPRVIHEKMSYRRLKIVGYKKRQDARLGSSTERRPVWKQGFISQRSIVGFLSNSKRTFNQTKQRVGSQGFLLIE